MTNKVPNFQIGLVGGSQSGKTLYITCLQRFIENNKENITFQGADNESMNWLESRKTELLTTFPKGTLVEKNLNFILCDDKYNVAIKVLDRMGGDFVNQDDTVINYLAECTGFVILIDPSDSLKTQSALYRPLFERLNNYLRGKNLQRINRRFSICLTKIDDPDFIRWYLENKEKYPRNGNVQFDKWIFSQWFNTNNGVDNFIKSLEIKFRKENFRYFLISSLGFFDQDNHNMSTNLVILENGEKRLRNGEYYSPVNLYEPLYWAMGGKRPR